MKNMNLIHGTRQFAFAALAGFAALSAQAAPVMPDFANAASWGVDRYAPASFATVPSFQGRSDVLAIGITSAGNLANRAAPFNDGFYNTQGRQTAITGGAGSTLAADLYIGAGWSSNSNGAVRSDMWGVVSDFAVAPTLEYPIIGFTNEGGTGRYRVYDADAAGGWVDLATAVTENAWTSMEILFTGAAYEYKINGTLVYTDSTITGSGFSAVIMQAYNFADPSSRPNEQNHLIDYTAYWDNVAVAQVPEPASLGLVALALLGAVGASRRRKV